MGNITSWCGIHKHRMDIDEELQALDVYTVPYEQEEAAFNACVNTCTREQMTQSFMSTAKEASNIMEQIEQRM